MEDADAVMDLDRDMGVDMVSRVRVVKAVLHGEEKKTLAVRAVSFGH